jgi:dihydrofolate synthase / folylpolyglutamate synthase
MDSRDWLVRLEAFGIKLGLDTSRRLAAALGHPERACPIVHVAGTNGKGSVTAMVSRALTAAGYRTARYTSPHLIRLEERFVVDDRPLPADAVDAALDDVRRAVSSLQASGELSVEPTYFEATTAAAFLAFRAAAAEIAVIEVGLGGRFDATNIVDPAVVAITSIARDHEAQLGHRLEAIAMEKAGVIKPGVPVVAASMPVEAAAVVADAAASCGAPLEPPAAISGAAMVGGRLEALFSTPRRRYGPVTLALRGRHQLDNAAVAVRVLELLNDHGLSIDADHVVTGLAAAVWPGRLDLVGRPPRQALVDGAHNPAGIVALVDYLREVWPDGLPVVFGAMSDKPLAEMLAVLAPAARPLIVTAAPGQRAAPPERLLELAHAVVEGDRVVMAPRLAEALATGWSRAPVVVVAGSLYLAGAALDAVDRP